MIYIYNEYPLFSSVTAEMFPETIEIRWLHCWKVDVLSMGDFKFPSFLFMQIHFYHLKCYDVRKVGFSKNYIINAILMDSTFLLRWSH